MQQRGRRIAVTALLVPLLWPAWAAEERGGEPLELGLEERVAVQLVLLDFLVRNPKGEIVTDLEIEDFVLRVDGKKTRIVSLDRVRVGGMGEGPAAETAPAVPAPVTPRTVLVFDYFHMTDVAATYDRVIERTARAREGDEHMIVSLGDVLRVEMPFSRDLDQLRSTLLRMRDDPDLYAGNHERLTERRFYERVQSLFDVLEPLPGRKALVLFSGPFQADGWYHDVEHKEIAARATAVRAALYPVDTAGLVTDPAIQLGGPYDLRRLANETGGRMTADTNDVALAWEHAEEDARFIYTIGFHDENPRFDRERRFRLKVRKRGELRVIYPEYYVIRSPEEQQRSLARTAAMMPVLFESPDLAIDVAVLGPHSEKRWRVGFSVTIDPETGQGSEGLQVEGLVRRENGTIVHRFKEHVSAVVASREVKLSHEFSARPGRYLVSAVLSDENRRPRATTRTLELPELPKVPDTPGN